MHMGSSPNPPMNTSCLEFRFRVPINLSLHFRGRGWMLIVPVGLVVFDPGANFVQILRPARSSKGLNNS